MKQLSVLTIAFFAVCSLAIAGPEAISSGKEMKEVAPAPAPSGCNWTGLYLGINGGYNWLEHDSIDTVSRDIFGNPGLGGGPAFGVAAANLATFSFDNSNNGFIGGGQIGYNWQYWRFVFGPEADIDGVPDNADTTGASTVTGVPGFAANTITQTADVSRAFNYIGTVRGRIGFAVTPCLLVYGTGGFAYGEAYGKTAIVQQITGPSLVPNPYGGTGKFSDTLTGWTAGGGVEWMFWHHWSIRAEYLHYEFGDVSYNVRPLNNFNTAGTLFTTTAPTTTSNFNGNEVRGGLNFHF
jgi:outer membrane immunogenic protein